MNYLMFIWAEGRPGQEDLAVMQREIPGWVEEMDGRGVRLLGRELELPEKAATVRVRDGETLVTDGPFLETKEFVAGFDLLDCADLGEAIEVAAKTPVSWFQTVELRPFTEAARVQEAFASGGGKPYCLIAWADAATGGLQGAETATTVRVRDGETLLGDGPRSGTERFIAGIDVVRCTDRQQAIERAAAHPVARTHAIEVRPFYGE
jgi:hypothetical protein